MVANDAPLSLCPASYVALAEQLADAARDCVLPLFRSNLLIDQKADRSPVTEADRAVEALVRARIEAECPDHGILGEEAGVSGRPDADWVWVIDPIDGTRAFIAGMPTFTTLIALTFRSVPVLGLIDQPMIGDRWLGAAGRSTQFNGQKSVTRSCRSLDRAHLKTTSPELFEGADLARFARLSHAVGHTCYGGDAYNYGLLAAGFLDLVAEAGLAPHDFCALVPVIEGAGGIITDWAGAPMTLESEGHALAAGDRAVHSAALALMG